MMTRLACALVLLALGLLLAMLFDTTGATAIAASFIGAPALAAGAALFLWEHRADLAKRLNNRSNS
ncbi:MAG: hypothetical protein MJA83_06345 [Gammaproteobacteria bacterium]|nr:hypothetical protein [Gammaproteobacteria bacterium]